MQCEEHRVTLLRSVKEAETVVKAKLRELAKISN